MAFKRIVEMQAGTSQFAVIISDLDIAFDINRTRELANNVAKFKVYNPTQDTISRILKKGNSVTFKAGYEDEGLGLIYVGQITQAIPEGQPPDQIVHLECGSIQNPNTELSKVTITAAYKKGTVVSRPIDEIGIALGLSVTGLGYLQGIVMANGYNIAGTAKDALRYVQDILERYGLGIFIDNDKLKVYKIDAAEQVTAVKLTPNTGLIEAPKLVDNNQGNEAVQRALTKRVLFKSLLNYKIVPNGMVHIVNSKINVMAVVDKCSFKGDNFGGDFYVSGEALSE